MNKFMFSFAMSAFVTVSAPAWSEGAEPFSCLFTSDVNYAGTGGNVRQNHMVYYDKGAFFGTLDDIATQEGLKMHYVALSETSQRPSSVKIGVGGCNALTFQEVSSDKANVAGYDNLAVYYLPETPNFQAAKALDFENRMMTVNVNDPVAVACLCEE